MIVSLVGRADNYNVIFNQADGGQWEATVPVDLSDGMYVIELWATDEYGNVSYYTAILYLFDGRTTYLEVIEESYQVLILNDKFNVAFNDKDFRSSLGPEKYAVNFTERLVVVM